MAIHTELGDVRRPSPVRSGCAKVALQTRGVENVRGFLRQDGNGEKAWRGTLVTDGFSGYKASFERGVTEAGCVAHARRKFHELWADHASKVGQQALRYFQVLFRIEEDIAAATAQERRCVRQRKSRRVASALHKWLLAQRQLVPAGSAMRAELAK